MRYAIEMLKKETEALRSEIMTRDGGDTEAIEKKLEVEEAVKWLQEIQGFKLTWRTSRVMQIPNNQAGYSEIRMMIDNETDNRDLWSELILHKGNKMLKLHEGDVLIVRS